MVYGFVQLHYITDLEEIFIFINKKVSYLYGFWRFANAYKIIVVKGEIWTVDVETLEDVERILEGLEVQL